MAPLLIGYARVSTDEQDLTAQREASAALGVNSERMYVDHGLTGTSPDRPGPREALAACREGEEAHLVALHRAGEHSGAEVGDLFGVACSTVSRAIQRDEQRRQTPNATHAEGPATPR
jgi:hypothetical protein